MIVRWIFVIQVNLLVKLDIKQVKCFGYLFLVCFGWSVGGYWSSRLTDLLFALCKILHQKKFKKNFVLRGQARFCFFIDVTVFSQSKNWFKMLFLHKNLIKKRKNSIYWSTKSNINLLCWSRAGLKAFLLSAQCGGRKFKFFTQFFLELITKFEFGPNFSQNFTEN